MPWWTAAKEPSMKRRVVLIFLVVVAMVVTADAGDTRTLTRSVDAGSVTRLVLDSGIGDVEIIAAPDATEIAIEVVLTPRRGGFFSSKRRAEQEVEAAVLSAEIKRDRLQLKITPEADDDRRFEENWSITLPASVALKLSHGVGDIDIRGAEAGVDIESGVGEVRVEVGGGEVSIELGVGTAVVRGPAAAYASAEGAGGVGDARITARGEKISGAGFVSHSATWEGDGNFHIEVSVGVGDAVITLD
jgi:hypothetical protein